MILPDDLGAQDAACGIQRIHCRIDTLGSDLTGKDSRCVQMREGCRRCRVGQVIGRDIDCLNRCDGTILRRCDALLELAHLGCQRRLVPDGGRHTSQKGGHLGACLRETEDVVDEEQDVLLLHVTEILRNRQPRKTDSHTGSRRLVHLSEDQRRLVDDT